MWRDYWRRLTSSSPPVQWISLAGSFALIVVIVSLSAGLLMNVEETGKKDARSASTEKKASEERAQSPKESAKRTAEKTIKPTPPPEPHAPEERILWRLEKTNHDVNLVNHLDPIVVKTTPNGCKVATISYETIFVGSNLNFDPPTYYRAVYRDHELRDQICLVRTNA